LEPAKYFVVVTRREKRACHYCGEGGVTAAPLAPRIVEKGLVSDRIVIDTLIQKYSDHRVSRRRWLIWQRRTIQKMRVGPSTAAIRSRFQTTVCCCR
jgi:transposase